MVPPPHTEEDILTDTIAAPLSPPELTTTTSNLVWVETDVVNPPVWIGRYRGVTIGIIEHREPEGYTSTTHRGRGLGNFETLEDAQNAFYRT